MLCDLPRDMKRRAEHVFISVNKLSMSWLPGVLTLNRKFIHSFFALFCRSLPAVKAAVRQVNDAVSSQHQAALLAALRLEALALLGVQESNSNWYLEHFTTYCQHKSKVLNYCLFHSVFLNSRSDESALFFFTKLVHISLRTNNQDVWTKNLNESCTVLEELLYIVLFLTCFVCQLHFHF